ncbi:MAG: hypothetical protein LBH68_07110 [Bifidobacteriaceae bacterium]|nr:hypothetical protein [Bifidobacteriaceae bacterium]
MIRLTVDRDGRAEVFEGEGAQAVGEQMIERFGPSRGPVPWEDQMDDGWTFPRFVITEELVEWAAREAGVQASQIRIEDL